MNANSTAPVQQEFKNQFSVPDFESFVDRYGWPKSDDNGYRIAEQLCGTERPLRVIVVGGGISGVNLAKLIPDLLNNVSLTIYEKNPELGGTWYENRYPGIRCDVPSHSYQFTWAKNPDWKEFYSSGEEIQKYVQKVIDTYDLRKYFLVNHQVMEAAWNEDDGVWKVKIKNLLDGNEFSDTAEVLINNEGLLNNWRWPKIEGLHSFKGVLAHTAVYDRSIDLNDKRVAVIGMGSTGLQLVPTIAPKVKQLYTFVRSPTWVTPGFAQKYAGPGGTNFEYSEEQKEHFRNNPEEYQKYNKGIENELNVRFRYILQGTPEALEAKKFSVDNMKSKLGGREDLEDAIIPKNFGLGCRRPTPGAGFLESLLRDNVTTFTHALDKITEKGFISPDGDEIEVDVIICATGFDTSFVPRYPIWYHGQNLQETRKKELLSYISLATPDVPNYFGICGPYGPFAHGSFMTISEVLSRNIIKVIRKMQRELIKSVTPKREACEAFARHCDLFVKRTAWSGPCSSWFKNGDPNGRLSVFPGSRLVYWELLSEPRFEDYHIKYLSGNEFQWLGNGFHVIEFNGGDNSWYLGAVDDPITVLPKEAESISPEEKLAVQ